MEKLVVIKSFKSHGIQFKKNDVFYGRWVYASKLQKIIHNLETDVLPLVGVSVDEHSNALILPKENFALIND